MKRALRYSILLCIVSWLFFALIYYFGNVRSVTNPLYIPIASVYMLLPMICALTMERFEGRGERRTLNLVSFKMNWYWLIALLLPILITLIVVAIDIWLLCLGYKTEPIVPQSVLDSLGSDKLQQILSNRTNLALLVLLESLIAGSTINALFAFGEEYGWRKYLVESLQDRGFMEVALFIGGVWGIWHLPMILIGHNYAEHNIAGIFMMILFCMSLGVLELYVVVKCRSVVAAAVLHGTINAAGGLPNLMFENLNPIIESVPGLVGVVVISIVAGIILLSEKQKSGAGILGVSLRESLSVDAKGE